MKKLINDIPDVVKEQLEGMALAHPDMLTVHYEPNYIYRADAPVAGKVALISGGGSGHEPMHGGFVGMGMLDAACPGEVFTSPTPDQMYEAAKAVNSGAGVLFLVKNYTGDVLNFETAAELAARRRHCCPEHPDRRRRRRQGQPLHGRSPRCRHNRPGREDRRRSGRSRLHAGSMRRSGPQGQQLRPHDGHGPDLLHCARRGQTDLRPGRRRDRDRHRHPRRTGPEAHAHGYGRRDHRRCWPRRSSTDGAYTRTVREWDGESGDGSK